MKLDHKAKAAEEVHSNSDSDGAFAAGAALPQMDKWLVDSGSSSHMTSQMEFQGWTWRWQNGRGTRYW